MGILILFILICVALFFCRKFLAQFKIPKTGAVSVFTGGIKAGKSTCAVQKVRTLYIYALISYYFSFAFCKVFRRELPEKPLIYSNIPLAIKFFGHQFKYVELTRELIFRQNRFRYGSVVYFNEASLAADKDIYKDEFANMSLMVFNKLFGHETKGGSLIYDTQSISDLPAAIRRCLSQYFYVHHTVKWIPFFALCYVREDRYSEDGSVIAVSKEDVEESLKKVIIRKSIWKMFSSTCMSKFTDDLPVEDRLVLAGKDLRVTSLVTFQDKVKIVAEGGKK